MSLYDLHSRPPEAPNQKQEQQELPPDAYSLHILKLVQCETNDILLQSNDSNGILRGSEVATMQEKLQADKFATTQNLIFTDPFPPS